MISLLAITERAYFPSFECDPLARPRKSVEMSASEIEPVGLTNLFDSDPFHPPL